MRWKFKIWNFGYEDAFDYCKDIWLAFGHNVVVGKYTEHFDGIKTLIWSFTIDDLPCIWVFTNYPRHQYIILYTKETEENLKRLEAYIQILIDELNRCVKDNKIEPSMESC